LSPIQQEIFWSVAKVQMMSVLSPGAPNIALLSRWRAYCTASENLDSAVATGATLSTRRSLSVSVQAYTSVMSASGSIFGPGLSRWSAA
jgi:hypothetical protein